MGSGACPGYDSNSTILALVNLDGSVAEEGEIVTNGCGDGNDGTREVDNYIESRLRTDSRVRYRSKSGPY